MAERNEYKFKTFFNERESLLKHKLKTFVALTLLS